MKVSKAYFEEFKKEFVDWQERLGLTQYEIEFKHEVMLNKVATLQVNEMGKLVTVKLAKNLNKYRLEEGAEKHARHEILHLLLNRMRWLGEARYIENDDLQEEWEALVRRLEKVL